MNPQEAMLSPVLALVMWTAVMWLWMYVTRIPAITKAGMELDPSRINGQQMAELPASVRWKADNYNHLLEQPVLFYATALALAILGTNDSLSVNLAWAYVGSRVVHSLIQALWNKIEVRFAVFSLSSLILFTLAGRGLWTIFS